MSEVKPGYVGVAKCIVEVLAFAKQRHFSVNRTKLVKLLYFADLRAVEKGLSVRSEISWKWHNYGPFSTSVLVAEDALVYSGAITREHDDRLNFDWLVSTEDFVFNEDLTEQDVAFFEIIRSVVDELGSYSAKRIAQISYSSPPMELAQEDGGLRGAHLDLSLGESTSGNSRDRKLSRLASLRERRAEVRNRKDEGNLQDLQALLGETSIQRGRATGALLGPIEVESF